MTFFEDETEEETLKERLMIFEKSREVNKTKGYPDVAYPKWMKKEIKEKNEREVQELSQELTKQEALSFLEKKIEEQDQKLRLL